MNPTCEFLIQVRRAKVFRGSFGVLVLVVVRSLSRPDLQQRKRLAIEDARREFTSAYHLLHQDGIVKFQRLIERGAEDILGYNNLQTHA